MGGEGLICFGPRKLQRREHEVQQRGERRLLHQLSRRLNRIPSPPLGRHLLHRWRVTHRGEGDTVLPGDGGMDPSVVRGDMSGYGGIPQGLIGVPPTPMYTPYGQPLTPYVFGHGHVGPRGDGLGASPINPTGRPRFPGHSPYGSQSYSKGLNPRVPLGSPNGISTGTTSRFSPRYSQVFQGMGGSVDIPEGRGVVYGTGEGHRSPDGVGVPRESRDAFSHEDMIPEGPEEDLVSSEEEGSQDEGEQGPVVPEGGYSCYNS